MSSEEDSGSNGPRPVRLAMLYRMLVDGGLHTAVSLGEATGASKSTVYRDVARLREAGLEIEGTTRLGYRLPRVPELSPLFLTRSERAALVAVAPAGLRAKLRAL